jgi:hypothetical protein
MKPWRKSASIRTWLPGQTIDWYKLHNPVGAWTCLGCEDQPPAAYAGIVNFDARQFQVCACAACFEAICAPKRY